LNPDSVFIVNGEPSKYVYRIKYRNVDSDPYLEIIADYLNIDANRDGIITKTQYDTYINSRFDCNGNGNGAYFEPGIDNVITTDDATEWHNLSNFIVKDNVHGDSAWDQQIHFASGNVMQYILFDANNDDKLDLYLAGAWDNPSTVSVNNLVAYGTDSNNDGLIEGIDMNKNGSENDYFGIVNNIGYSHFPDYQLSAILNDLPCENIVIGVMCCRSGGWINELSKAGRIIFTATTDGFYGWSTDDQRFVNGLDSTGNFLNADANKDGNVTIVELYNYAYSNDSQNIYAYSDDGPASYPQYEDNGNGVLTHEIITPGINGTGCLGNMMTLGGKLNIPTITGTISTNTSTSGTIVNLKNMKTVSPAILQVHSAYETTLNNIEIGVGSQLIIDNNVCK